MPNTIVFIEVLGLFVLAWTWKSIVPNHKYLAVYLITAVVFECMYMIADPYGSKYNLILGNIYSLIEVWVLSILYTQWNKEKTGIFYLFSLIYFLVWAIYYLNNGLSFMNGIIHGMASLIIMVMSIIAYIRYLASDYKSFKLPITLGFIFYSCTNVGIMTFSAYLSSLNSEKVVFFYYVINLFSNLGLYIFMTIGLIKCKKQSSELSSY